MFNPDIQYRCTIIRGKAQKELDNLLPAYANIVAEICPCTKEIFDQEFNDRLSQIIYNDDYENLGDNNQKTIRNHITEVAGKLFGLYYFDEHYIYESPSNEKLLIDNDQPAFFKNLCLNFQFPNGTQKIQTIEERLNDGIKFKPFHFVLTLLSLAQKSGIILSKDEIGYYVLNAKQVLQGNISVEEVLGTIIKNRENLLYCLRFLVTLWRKLIDVLLKMKKSLIIMALLALVIVMPAQAAKKKIKVTEAKR